ncbi:679_t:CDS:2 [Paraglomus brasilianum]|uniref:679_t:CDS:1 n=1 Tax=Paraglomus brasilianum TaxID=144538 RepID=A0A9N9AFG4_9GLOM|nr:679_t:CDS:2 [Paraglomus brasilianum]
MTTRQETFSTWTDNDILLSEGKKTDTPWQSLIVNESENTSNETLTKRAKGLLATSILNRTKDSAELKFDNWLSIIYLPVKENINQPVDSALAEVRQAYDVSLNEAIVVITS